MEDSRWWYWVAGVPAVAGFWLVVVAWLLVVLTGTDLLGGSALRAALEFSLLVTGVPFLVVGVLFPVAVYRDAVALERAGSPWQPSPARTALLAAGSLLAGPVLSAPLACYYLYRRHVAVGRP